MSRIQSIKRDPVSIVDEKNLEPSCCEAWFYSVSIDGKLHCNLCSHGCAIPEGKTGVCGVRFNSNGVLYTLVYGKVISLNLDPIEKKPLYHFYPGSTTYSIATPGCNFRCKWCQNWEISQMPREQNQISGGWISPEEVVADANALRCRSIAYTYTEPTIFFEYVYDAARLAKSSGLANVIVTNGYMSNSALQMLHNYIDGANVDLKAFSDETYRRFIGGRLQPVLDILITMKEMGIWVEVTTLVIPGLNDGNKELRDIARFIAQELGRETPWHISRFFPAYKMPDHPTTPMATLRRANDIGHEEGLHYVYIDNTLECEGNDTICPSCGSVLFERCGSVFASNSLRNGCCPHCGKRIPGVGM